MIDKRKQFFIDRRKLQMIGLSDLYNKIGQDPFIDIIMLFR